MVSLGRKTKFYGANMKYPGHESSKLEFKSSISKNDQIINTIIAFCNMYGVKLIIGIDDEQNIVGLPEKKSHETTEWLNEAIYSASAPPILPQIYQQHLDDKYLVVVDVSAGMQKPYYKKSLGMEEGTYIRLGRSTLKADLDMIEELKLQARGKSYDQTPVYHASREDLDDQRIKLFFSERRNGAKATISDDMLRSYDILVEQHAQLYPTVAGLLLFSKDPQNYLTENYTLCSHFSGIKGREAIASQVCKGTLFEQFDAAYDFIVNRLHKAYTIKGKQREETLEIPPVAIREVLMNALLHRNYHLKEPVKIAVYDNRLEIFSPGVFPGAIDITQLDSGITYTRNVAVAKILWECRYIEKMGSGFITLFDSCETAGLAKPDIIEGTNFVKAIIYRERKSGEILDDHAKVMALLRRFDEISRSDIVEQLKIPKTTAGRILNALISSGKLIRIGEGRSTRYRLP